MQVIVIGGTQSGKVDTVEERRGCGESMRASGTGFISTQHQVVKAVTSSTRTYRG